MINGIPLEKQAEYLNVGDYLAYKEPRVFANTQFQLFDVPPRKEFPRNSQALLVHLPVRPLHGGRQRPSRRPSRT